MATSATGLCYQTLSMEAHVALRHESCVQLLVSEKSSALSWLVIMCLGKLLLMH